jgi:hypothetical protein
MAIGTIQTPDGEQCVETTASPNGEYTVAWCEPAAKLHRCRSHTTHVRQMSYIIVMGSIRGLGALSRARDRRQASAALYALRTPQGMRAGGTASAARRPPRAGRPGLGPLAHADGFG